MNQDILDKMAAAAQGSSWEIGKAASHASSALSGTTPSQGLDPIQLSVVGSLSAVSFTATAIVNGISYLVSTLS